MKNKVLKYVIFCCIFTFLGCYQNQEDNTTEYEELNFSQQKMLISKDDYLKSFPEDKRNLRFIFKKDHVPKCEFQQEIQINEDPCFGNGDSYKALYKCDNNPTDLSGIIYYGNYSAYPYSKYGKYCKEPPSNSKYSSEDNFYCCCFMAYYDDLCLNDLPKF